MPIVAKVSLATALPTVRNLVSDLVRAAKDAGPIPGLDAVASGASALDAYSMSQGLEGEVVVVSPLLVAEAGKIGLWLGSGFPVGSLAKADQRAAANLALGGSGGTFHVVVRPLADTTAVAAGTTRPPVLVLLVGNPSALDPERAASLERLMEDRPRVLVIGPPTHAAVASLAERARVLAWSAEVIDPAAPPETALAVSLGTSPWDGAQELVRAHSVAVALESLVGVFELALDQQARDTRLKKSVTQARLGPPAKPGLPGRPLLGGGPGNELLGDIKTRIQRHTNEYERGATERLVDLLAPASGSLAREIEAMLASLEDLKEEPRSTKIETRIPPEFEQKLVRTLRERIARHCSADVVGLNDLFRLLKQEIETTLTAAGGPPYVPSFAFLTEERVRRLLDMSAVPQYVYRGELPRRGFNEYFASVRKYSMLLVMGASMFGLSQFMRQFREYTVPATIVLVLWGVYSVATSTREQRVENLEKELEAARTAIRPDMKRIFSEVQKSWGSALQQHLNDQVTTVLAELDGVIKDHQARKGAESSPEKERLGRQLAQLEAAEKKLLLPMKARETLATSIIQVRSDMKGLLPKPGAPKPLVPSPGAVGAVGDAKAKLAALKAQGSPAEGGAAGPSTSAAQSALDAAKAKMAALKAGASSPPAAGAAASPSPFDAARAKMAALKAQAAERTAASAAAKAVPKAPAAPAAPAQAPAVTPAAVAAAPPAAPAVAVAPAPAPPVLATAAAVAPAPVASAGAAADAKARFEALRAEAAARRAAREAGGSPPAAAGTPPQNPAAVAPAAPAAAPSPAPKPPENESGPTT
jgi:hypothetical protein